MDRSRTSSRRAPEPPRAGAPAVVVPPPWRSRRIRPTPETRYWNRREFLKTLGAAGVAALVPATGCGHDETVKPAIEGCDPLTDLDPAHYPPLAATVNPTYAGAAGRPVTAIPAPLRWNNFYEFSLIREEVWCLSKAMRTDPWSIEIAGLTESPRRAALEDVMAVAPLEERLYRFRCVEAWAMTVPWVGYPLGAFLRWCRPRPEATHVRFTTAYQPDAMVNHNYIWPYYDGLRLDEAMNDLALLAFGVYGHVLPNQNGAPVRVVMPWKYGFKSIKSVVRVEFTAQQPHTFWNDVEPGAYSFLSNVDPDVSHPRWSQRTETLIDTGDVVPTLEFNGYGEWVAGLYA